MGMTLECLPVSLLLLLGCLLLLGWQASSAAVPGQTASCHDLPSIISPRYPLFAQLRGNQTFVAQFMQYFQLLASLNVPDAVFIMQLIKADRTDLAALTLVFHEQVELWRWMTLGNPFEHIMNMTYNGQHYPLVYPMAHSLAVESEANIFEIFAEFLEVPDVPVVLYFMLNPLFRSYYGKRPELAWMRLKANPAIQRTFFEAQVDAKELLESTVVPVYELGCSSFAQLNKTQFVEQTAQFLYDLNHPF